MSTADARIIIGGEPRVFLLPPEVKAAEKAKGTRRAVVMLVVLAVVVVGAGYAASVWRLTQAHTQLTAEQADTVDLLTQQTAFSEVTSIASQTAAITGARIYGASTEVLWRDFLAPVQAAMPDGVVIGEATMAGEAPWEPTPTPAGPLRQDRIVAITFKAISVTIPSAAQWSRAFSGVEGFADATPDASTWNEEEGVYETTITLNINADVLSGRFTEGEEN